MTAPRLPSVPEHATPSHAAHDPVRVAEAADRAGRLPSDLAACPDCVALHADLVVLATALPTTSLPARPRDYALTPADAARLRPGGWRRWLAAIGSSRDVITRPLAIGFTTLGLAGLLVATVPGALPGGAGTAGSAEVGDAAPTQLQAEAPAAESSALPMAASPAPDETDGGVFSGVDATDAAASARTGNAPAATAAPFDEASIRDDASGVSALVVVAGLLMLAGLSLFGLRWTARHLA